MDYSGFSGKTALITGAGGDHGGGVAVELARHGASLALIDVHDGRLNATVEKCVAAGLSEDKIFSKVGDVRDPIIVNRFVDAAVVKFGKINILFNVVGTKRMTDLHTTMWTDWEYVIDGNLKTMFHITKACLEPLKASKGVVLNMTSVTGIRQSWRALTYSTVKAAVNQFTRAIAVELAPHGVRVNAVAPGALKSRYNLRMGDCLLTEEQLKTYETNADTSIPWGRIGRPLEEVVPLCVFLLSDKSSFTTGSIIPVSGAYHNTSYTP